MKTFWLNRTTFEKLFLITIAILSILLIISSFKYQVVENKLYKSEKEQLQLYKDSVSYFYAREQQQIEKSVTINKRAKNKATKTNEKLKKDIETIANSHVNDSVLSNMVATYERLTKNK